MSSDRGLEISNEEGNLFARLSGDYNPLHLDALYARRLQFGDTVVHGVHHMLRAWDMVATEIPWFGKRDLVSLRASLPSPVKYGDELLCNLELVPDRHTAKIHAEVNGLRCMSLELEYSSCDEKADQALASPVLDCPVVRDEIVDQTFPPSLTEGRFPLHCDHALAQRLFPNLSRNGPDTWLASILACTRVVGMACPGLHSVFTGFKLARKNDGEAEDRDGLMFQVSKTDKRFTRVRIDVDSAHIQGELDTFFRPSPVDQPTYSEINRAVTAGCFANQRALVIGGSRGIGETTAKILAAGGADVCITYFRGEDEARAVCEDILESDGRCFALPLNILEIEAGNAAIFTQDFIPSHIYYFATPKIEKLASNTWHEDVYEHYAQYYATPLRRLIELWTDAAGDNNVVLYYPSSIYVEEQPAGFQEYGAAKKHGEDLCNELAQKHCTLSVIISRLPTIYTDQTTSILPTNASSALDVMIAELGKLATTG